MKKKLIIILNLEKSTFEKKLLGESNLLEYQGLTPWAGKFYDQKEEDQLFQELEDWIAGKNLRAIIAEILKNCKPNIDSFEKMLKIAIPFEEKEWLKRFFFRKIMEYLFPKIRENSFYLNSR